MTYIATGVEIWRREYDDRESAIRAARERARRTDLDTWVVESFPGEPVRVIYWSSRLSRKLGED